MKSDIFIVRGWDSGQPLTIIRGIFLDDVFIKLRLFLICFFSKSRAMVTSHSMGALVARPR